MKGKSIQGKRKVKRDSKGKHSSHKHSSEKLEGSIIRPQLYLPHLVGIRPLLSIPPIASIMYPPFSSSYHRLAIPERRPALYRYMAHRLDYLFGIISIYMRKKKEYDTPFYSMSKNRIRNSSNLSLY